jgi:hypothetical protein
MRELLPDNREEKGSESFLVDPTYERSWMPHDS